LYERTAVSRKPDDLNAKDIAALRDNDRLATDMVSRDPYFLDLGLSGQHVNRSNGKIERCHRTIKSQ
jgi:predicted nuclease of restriction endonuclease-like (RecB) superfamily